MSKKTKKTNPKRVKIESITPSEIPNVNTAAVASETAAPKPKKISAIDAAARVLDESKEPLNAKEIIERMTTAGLWTSPAGKTPHATIYAAMLRSIAKLGDASQFRKAERGKFTIAS